MKAVTAPEGFDSLYELWPEWPAACAELVVRLLAPWL